VALSGRRVGWYDWDVLPSRASRAPALVAVLFAACALFALAAFALPAAAQPAPNADASRAAEAKKKEGDGHMSERRYADALEAYDQAYALAPNPVLHYNRGRALQFLARYPEALEALERFKADAPEAVRARVAVLDDLITELRGRVTTIELRCNVDGAQIRLGDRVIGTTPFAKPLVVNAGRAQLEISAEGRAPFTKTLELSGGETVVVEAVLEPVRSAATLRVHGRTAGAQVFVDGRAIGTAPATASVVPGMHSVRVERSGEDPGRADVVLASGEEKDLVVDPVARPGVTSKWWFWAGIGTAVAGGVALGFALTTERAGDQGTFSPGSLRVP
jgi:hypothetical protein